LFRRTQYITSIGLFYKKWEDCGGWLTCEELVGGYLEVLCLCEGLVGVSHRRRKKKEGEDDE